MKTKQAPSTAEIRAAFLDYFASKQHAVVPSASLVPRDDPTLLFVNAGMVPFKDAFTGATPPPAPRAASSQRCLRVSGKHNDLEEVGRTPRHHTLFEMLGNFSFGDYFKEDAIAFAYEFLVDRMKLDPARLSYSVFGGENGVPADDEAAEIWKRVAGVGDDRVLRFGMKDNFWAMGETGPCGPCSEIHYDLGENLEGTVNDGDRFVEIWNLVFMQYDRTGAGKLSSLPAPSIDTGMGLERISSVVQGKQSNYEGDLLRSLLDVVARVVGRPYEGGDDSDSVSMRVIADHARATAFLLSDGIHPDKTGRGYVLRKIMRRAISHAVLLDVHRPVLADVCEAVAASMGEAHPVLREQLGAVRSGADAEEALFRRTVEEGMRRIDELLEQLENDRVWTKGEDGQRALKGDVAFRLYDTHGCPLELTASVGVRRGFEVDEAGFFAAMAEQKERSRASWKGGGDADAVRGFFAGRREDVGSTGFRGYDSLEGESVVRALALVHDDRIVPTDRAAEGAVVVFATADTPFYGESGGQVGDTGVMIAEGGRIRIEDVKRTAGGEIFVHFGTVEEGEIGEGARVSQRVDGGRRRRVADHHSSTHLVHYALREILGPHVAQKGSYVAPDHLRFDFSHPDAVHPDELEAVEDRVNELVRANHVVSAESMPYADAIEAGALAFFGDKYGDEVRMVSMGPSKELCGGTHVVATGDVGLFTFSSEGSVASGVRRIEAFAGPAAIAHARRARESLERIAEALKTGPEDALEKLADLQEETKRLRKRIEELERQAAGDAAGELSGAAQDVAGHRLIAGRVPAASRDALRDLGDRLRASGPSTVVVLGTEIEGKVALLAALSDDVVKTGRLKAGDLVGKVAKVAGGGGGGKPHLATAGAKDPAKLDAALAAAAEIVAEALS
jgi:alanyl-tRNA synthetase